MSAASALRLAGRAAPFASGRTRRARRRRLVCGALALALAALVATALMVGDRFYPPDAVVRVVLGQTVPGASFTVGELRLPRAALGVAAGLAFGLGGVTFQTMLRNPLASPDVIGISSGASAAAVVAIVLLGVDLTVVPLFAIVGALVTATAITLLSSRRGVAGTRLILIGVGVAAMLDSVVSYVLVRASTWDLATASRWLTGSLNAAQWGQIGPLALAVAVLGTLLLTRARGLDLLQHGDDAAAALGVPVARTRVVCIFAAVALVAFATSAAGPIAFVAFLAGPIAARLVGPGGSLLVPAALVGAVLVVGSDLLAQSAFGARYPVGVVTGVLGAPYLIHLLIRTNRSGGSL